MRGNPSGLIDDPELFFISGRIFDVELPKEQRWLWKYFRTPVQRQFIFYYLSLGQLWQFTDHTGFFMNKRILFSLRVKLEKLLEAHRKAKSSGPNEMLSRIENGHYKI